MSEQSEVSGEVGSATHGILEFSNGAGHVTLRAEPVIGGLFHARFGGKPPEVRTSNGHVTIEYPRFRHVLDWRKQTADIVLNPSIPWEIVVNGGIADLEGQLADLRLNGFRIKGGASKLTLDLSVPEQLVDIQFIGGVSNAEIRRPAGVAASLRINGGASKLEFDNDQFGAVGGLTHLQSAEFASATTGYNVTINGGASKLAIRQG